MKYIKLALFLLIAVSGFSQAVKLDSTVIYESRNIYNNAGYYIGKDSFHVKSVRWAYGSDTFYQRIDTLIQRFPQRFITMDSIIGGGDYIRKDQNDTVSTYYTLWKDVNYEAKLDNIRLQITDGTAQSYMDATQLYTGDGNNRNGAYGHTNAFIYDDSDASKLDMYSNHATIDRQGYSATSSNEVPIVSEVKELINDSLATRLGSYLTTTQVRGEINDSLDTRLASYTDNTALEEKIEDKIGSKLAVGTDLDITYNDGTGVTTINYTGSGGGGGGLTDEQVRDTTIAMFTPGPSIILNETDAEDSVFLDVNINPVESAVQSRIIGKSFGCAIAGTSSITTIGMTFNTTGTANGTTLNSSTAYRARAHKYEYVVTTASTTAVAGYRGGSDEFRGTEGFVYSVTWGPAIGCANTSKRAFAGIRNSPGAPTDVSPSTLTECIGMGYDDASDSNIQIYYNDGSGTASNIDLGSNFAIPTADRTNFYTLILYVPAGGSAYYYKVINESTGNVTTGNVTTNLPPASSFTRPFIYTSVGGVSDQTGIGIFSIYRMSL